MTAPATTAQTDPAGAARDTAVGVLAMLGAMAAFVTNDVCVKLAAATLPLGEVITLRNLIAAALVFVGMGVLGGLRWPPRVPAGLMALRIGGEIAATLLFLGALVALPFADVMAIVQVAPLMITAAAALLLGEPVGWRRWLATAVGLVGVALIVRPGSAAFSLAGLVALLSVVFVVMRDLATRVISREVPTAFLSVTSLIAGIVAGLVLLPFETWRLPSLAEAALAGLSGLFLAAGSVAMVIALRTGDVSVVSPFRYAIIVFALIASAVVWGERPDELAFLGTAIVCGAGLYTLHREQVRRRTGSA